MLPRTYIILLLIAAAIIVPVTYLWFSEYSIFGFIFLAFSVIEGFLYAHDAIIWRKVDLQDSIKEKNMPAAIVMAARYIAFAIVVAAALMGVPKAAGATFPIVETARRYIGQTETNGANRSPVIDGWNMRYGVKLGSAYCATATSDWSDESNVVSPAYRGGYSRGFVNKESIALPLKNWIDLAGYILVFARNGGGHVCVIESGTMIVHTIEANTSPGNSGSQWNGGGIYPRERNLRQLSSKYNMFRATHITPVRYA